MAFSNEEQQSFTRLLCETAGQDSPMDQIFPQVYEELRALAHGLLYKESAACTVNTTALVHEAYIRLVDNTQISAKGCRYYWTHSEKNISAPWV